MQGTVHAFDFIAEKEAEIPDGICALFGTERFLQNLAVQAIRKSASDDAGEFGISRFDGASCQLRDVIDEITTRSLFDSESTRIAIVDDADAFVKQNRGDLEELQKKPFADAVLVLVVNSWASNTRLYKQIDKTGLQVHCDAPIIKRGRGKQRDDARIFKWLVDRAKREYEFELPQTGATVLVELSECNFGRMDQELAKLSLYADPEKRFSPMDVRQIVGGWPAQTMWTAIDAALDGRAGHALDLLHQLFAAGEHPLAMFGQISWSLRRYAEAGELVQRDSRLGRRVNLSNSLKDAGFRSWGNEMESAAQRLKQLGRSRVAELLDWVVDTDFALKRSHSREDRGRLMLELLFTRMSEELRPVQTAAKS